MSLLKDALEMNSCCWYQKKKRRLVLARSLLWKCNGKIVRR
jgi:hypothetical protein